MSEAGDQTVHADVYDPESGERVARLTNPDLIPDFEASGIWEVERR